MIDVTRMRGAGPGLSPAQLAQLVQLERLPQPSAWQGGEARALAMFGTPAESARALVVVAKAARS